MTQQGDVLLCQTNDDGEISVINGLVEMSGGLSTSVYLSIFGGNSDDAGGDDKALEFWANIGTDTDQNYRSKTQNLTQSLPAIPLNLRRIEDAANSDLSWMLSNSIASSIDIVASIPAINRVKLVIKIQANGQESEFEFTENWKAQ